MDSKQCNPSNSGANLGLKRAGFCLDPSVDDWFGSFPAVLESAEEEVASELGPFTGPRPKANLQLWPSAISKWLNIDMNMLLCSEDFENRCLLFCWGCCVCNDARMIREYLYWIRRIGGKEESWEIWFGFFKKFLHLCGVWLDAARSFVALTRSWIISVNLHLRWLLLWTTNFDSTHSSPYTLHQQLSHLYTLLQHINWKLL